MWLFLAIVIANYPSLILSVFVQLWSQICAVKNDILSTEALISAPKAKNNISIAQ